MIYGPLVRWPVSRGTACGDRPKTIGCPASSAHTRAFLKRFVTGFALVAVLLIAAMGDTARAADGPDPELVPGEEDVRVLRQALNAANKGKWRKVESLGRKLRHPLSKKTLRWARLTGIGSTVNNEELFRFLKNAPDWPRRKRLIAKIELNLSSSADDSAVRRWFRKNPPQTTLGKVRFAELTVRRGERKKGVAMLRDIWINSDFNGGREKAFLKKHGRKLRQDDHWERLNRLLWEGKHKSARRLIWRVPKAYQRLAEARLLLRRREGNVDRAIKRVPLEVRGHPGLVYERVQWRRKKGKDSALELMRRLGGDLPHAEKWWTERAILARRALQKGYITDAYWIARHHGLEEGAGFADGEWLAGWIALRFLNEADVALTHFKNMYSRVKFPVSLARGAYWTARAYAALGKRDKAREWHLRAAEHPTTYYGQLSVAAVGPGTALPLPRVPKVSRKARERFNNHELTAVYHLLSRARAEQHQRAILQGVLDAGRGTPGWAAMTSALAQSLKRPDLAIRIAKQAARDGHPMPQSGYPRVKPPKLLTKWGLKRPEVPLVLGVIRQESLFRQYAKSSANAQGLMQILPSTASGVAKKLRLPYSKRKLTRDPTYNLILGQAYLAGLIKEFKGSYVLTLAAYNAGPGRARQWIKDHGDPRKREIDAIDWVEMIPFYETRNYVQRVMENLHVYRAILSPTQIALAPERELNRSGPFPRRQRRAIDASPRQRR